MPYLAELVIKFPIDWDLNDLRVRPVLAKLQQKNASENVDFFQKSEVTLFTQKMSSILDEAIKVTVQTWNAIPCRTRNKISNRLAFKPGKLNF